MRVLTTLFSAINKVSGLKWNQIYSLSSLNTGDIFKMTQQSTYNGSTYTYHFIGIFGNSSSGIFHVSGLFISDSGTASICRSILTESNVFGFTAVLIGSTNSKDYPAYYTDSSLNYRYIYKLT